MKMKRVYSIILTTMMTCLLFISAVTTASANEIVISDKGSSKWSIVTVSNTEEVKFAVEELRRYIERIGGAKLAVGNKLTGKIQIVIGLRKDLAPAYVSLLPQASKGYNGYQIRVSAKPDQIIIAGDDGPGVVYAVYEILEKLGCRWFYPTQDARDPEVVPQKERVALQTASWAVASPVKYRIANGTAWFFNMDYANALQQLDWAMKNRYNSIGWQAAASNSRRSLEMQYRDLEDAGLITALDKRGMFLHGPAHGFDQLLSTERYFADHPEWFGLQKGKRVPQAYPGAQFCWSNAQAKKQFVSNAVDFIRQAKSIRIFSVSPFDGGVACSCDNCTKQGSSNLLLAIMKDLIEALKTVRPEVMVETLGGYHPVTHPPTDLNAIHPELRILWAQWGRNHEIGYSDPAYNRNNLDGWQKAARGGLTICQYYPDNFAEPWIMAPFTTAMKSDRQYFLQHQIDAIYMLMWAPGYWWNHSLNAYIGGRVFYDVSLDPFSQIQDYGLHYFGKEAGPLLVRYYEAWATNVALSYRIFSGRTNDDDRKQLSWERGNLIDPAVEATKNDPLLSYRVSKVEKLHALAEKIAETQGYKQRIQALRETGDFRGAARLLAEARPKVHETMYTFYLLGGLNQGLIDIKEVPSFIKRDIQDWLDKEEAAIAAKDRTVEKEEVFMSEAEMLPAEVTQ